MRNFNDAAAVGQSDAEVYEGLAETWVRQVEMAVQRGQPTEAGHAAAIAASDRISIAEPQSIAGPLKKAFAALLSMPMMESGLPAKERVLECLDAGNAVLAREPTNPYANDLVANCLRLKALELQIQGEDPEPVLRKTVAILEQTVGRNPYFLWGVNDLGTSMAILVFI